MFDVAVVIPTVLRPQLFRAVQSIFSQDIIGRVQILIGVDKHLGDYAILEALKQQAPSHMHVTILDLGYSTSRRHGGLYPNAYGGALRTILSYMANSRYVAYLDDDNWFEPNHLSSLLSAIGNNEWAYSLRWYVSSSTSRKLCIDEWESVGPGDGVYNLAHGGFVDTNCYLLNKAACHDVLPTWSLAIDLDLGMGEDRLIFKKLRDLKLEYVATQKATVCYTLQVADPNFAFRQAYIMSKGISPN